MGYPILPIAVGVLFAGSIISGVVAAMSANDKRAGDLQRATIALAVFSTLCMLVTSIYWMPAVFQAARAPTAAPAVAYAPPHVSPASHMAAAAPQIHMSSPSMYGGGGQMHMRPQMQMRGFS